MSRYEVSNVLHVVCTRTLLTGHGEVKRRYADLADFLEGVDQGLLLDLHLGDARASDDEVGVGLRDMVPDAHLDYLVVVFVLIVDFGVLRRCWVGWCLDDSDCCRSGTFADRGSLI
jgi:hypothetical protein